MESFDSSDARARLPELLRRVEQGESFVITQDGRPLARLVPANPAETRHDMRRVVEAMLASRDQQGPTLGENPTIRDLIEECRR